MNQTRRTSRRGPTTATAATSTSPAPRARGRGERAILTGLTALVIVPIAIIVTAPLVWLAAHALRWAIS